MSYRKEAKFRNKNKQKKQFSIYKMKNHIIMFAEKNLSFIIYVMHINIAEPTVQLKMKLMMLDFISIYLQVHAPKKEPTIVVCRKILVAFFSLFRLQLIKKGTFWSILVYTICFYIDNLLPLVYFRAIYRHSTKVNQSLIRFSQFSYSIRLEKLEKKLSMRTELFMVISSMRDNSVWSKHCQWNFSNNRSRFLWVWSQLSLLLSYHWYYCCFIKTKTYHSILIVNGEREREPAVRFGFICVVIFLSEIETFAAYSQRMWWWQTN